MELSGKRFIASYSGGKDSVFAIYRAIRAGLVPHTLVTTYQTDAGRSWFHGLARPLLARVSAALGIPLRLIETTGEAYEKNFERILTELKGEGAEVCVFGDIDLEGHLAWCTKRCENVGLTPYFPLLREPRKKLVYDFVDSGFKTLITTVDTSRLPAEFLGQTLSRAVADEIERSGADICGENGEYHTFTYDGPIFSAPAPFTVAEELAFDAYRVLRLE